MLSEDGQFADSMYGVACSCKGEMYKWDFRDHEYDTLCIMDMGKGECVVCNFYTQPKVILGRFIYSLLFADHFYFFTFYSRVKVKGGSILFCSRWGKGSCL